jgi:hypothetical protein
MMDRVVQIVKKRGGKFLVTLWLIALTTFVVILIVGFFEGELLGSLAFSVLPVGVLVNISVVVAYLVENGSERIAKAAWAGVAVITLFLALYAFDGKSSSDIGVFLTWAMLVLAFPSSLLTSLLFTVIAIILEKLSSPAIPTSYPTLVLTWLGFFVIGYLQWFKLLPYLIGKLLTRKKVVQTR